MSQIYFNSQIISFCLQLYPPKDMLHWTWRKTSTFPSHKFKTQTTSLPFTDIIFCSLIVIQLICRLSWNKFFIHKTRNKITTQKRYKAYGPWKMKIGLKHEKGGSFCPISEFGISDHFFLFLNLERYIRYYNDTLMWQLCFHWELWLWLDNNFRKMKQLQFDWINSNRHRHPRF